MKNKGLFQLKRDCLQTIQFSIFFFISIFIEKKKVFLPKKKTSKKKMEDARTSFKNFFGDENDEDRSFRQEMNDLCPSLTYKQRITGFAICAGLGLLCSLLVKLLTREEKEKDDSLIYKYIQQHKNL